MLTQNRLTSMLEYNDKTGDFIWLDDRSQKAKRGDFAGTQDKRGHLYTRIDGVPHKNQNLAYLYKWGNLPKGTLEHIDGNKLNNRMDNLREIVTKRSRARARPKRVRKEHEETGIYYHFRECKWAANIRVKGRGKHLGYYFFKQDALDAVEKAKVMYGVED